MTFGNNDFHGLFTKTSISDVASHGMHSPRLPSHVHFLMVPKSGPLSFAGDTAAARTRENESDPARQRLAVPQAPGHSTPA